jgi:hypothetical protein
MDKVNPEVIMLSEADVPEHQLRAFDISYNFPYYSALTSVVVNGESAERIRAQWEKARATFPRGARFLHLNDNHDRNRADVVFGERATLATTVLNFTLDGVPFLYNGQDPLGHLEARRETPYQHRRPAEFEAPRLQADRPDAQERTRVHIRRADLD